MSNFDFAQFGYLVGPQDVLTFVLVLFRCLGIFLIAPILSARAIPNSVKIILGVSIALLIFPQIQFNDSLAVSSDLQLVQLIIKEVTVGLIIGFAAMVLFSAIQAGGEIVGLKIGFSIATILDPTSHSSTGVLTTFYTLTGTLLFLHLNGHHVLIEGLVQSFKALPLGSVLSEMVASSVADLVSQLFVIAIKIAAPILVVLTLLNLIFGLLTKISPQMNIYFNLGFVIGPVLGIFTILASLPLIRILITQLTENMRPEIFQMIRNLKGT